LTIRSHSYRWHWNPRILAMTRFSSILHPRKLDIRIPIYHLISSSFLRIRSIWRISFLFMYIQPYPYQTCPIDQFFLCLISQWYFSWIIFLIRSFVVAWFVCFAFLLFFFTVFFKVFPSLLRWGLLFITMVLYLLIIIVQLLLKLVIAIESVRYRFTFIKHGQFTIAIAHYHLYYFQSIYSSLSNHMEGQWW